RLPERGERPDRRGKPHRELLKAAVSCDLHRTLGIGRVERKRIGADYRGGVGLAVMPGELALLENELLQHREALAVLGRGVGEGPVLFAGLRGLEQQARVIRLDEDDARGPPDEAPGI